MPDLSTMDVQLFTQSKLFFQTYNFELPIVLNFVLTIIYCVYLIASLSIHFEWLFHSLNTFLFVFNVLSIYAALAVKHGWYSTTVNTASGWHMVVAICVFMILNQFWILIGSVAEQHKKVQISKVINLACLIACASTLAWVRMY